MLGDHVFTSESVTEGHPDKMADQVSDAVLDAMLEQDPGSRVACETMVSTGLVVLAGEVGTKARVDVREVARRTIGDIGYDDSSKGFDGGACEVMVALDEQSPDIARGVDGGNGKEQGAGDQGMMFGYAVNEAESLMPHTIDLAHRLSMRLAQVRKDGTAPLLGPDGKTQVSARYEGGRMTGLANVVVSTQHAEELGEKELHGLVREEVIYKVVPRGLISKDTKVWINPTGRFVEGGPKADCGLTGRKIIVDTYGGHGAHGGGAFSGKDPSKVDRSAAYAARHAAKHVVAAGLADRALVQVAYAIGVAEPMSFLVDAFGTEKVDLKRLTDAVRGLFDMRPGAIIERLGLLRPIYRRTAAYGHFGREGFPWESLDRVEELKSSFRS